jgi:two-component system LytT family response regulator
MRVLIVDDEAPARETLRRFCAEESGLDVVGESDRGDDAIDKIRRLRPDLVFLDIQMRKLSGIDVVRQVGADAMPMTVFVTAYDQYAVEAFELNAVDFLLKPFSRERFHSTVERLRQRVTPRDSEAMARWRVTLDLALRDFAREGTRRQVVAVEQNGRHRMLEVSEIELVEAAGNYIVMQTRANEKFILRRRITDAEDWLDPGLFLRVHRSHVVNLRAIREIVPSGNGDFLLTLRSGRVVESGRSYRHQVVELLRGWASNPARDLAADAGERDSRTNV